MTAWEPLLILDQLVPGLSRCSWIFIPDSNKQSWSGKALEPSPGADLPLFMAQQEKAGQDAGAPGPAVSLLPAMLPEYSGLISNPDFTTNLLCYVGQIT